MKIDPVCVPSHPLASAISPGIYPYLGGSVDPGLLRSVVSACGGGVVSGRHGAKLAARTPGVLVDPAPYGGPAATDSGPLFDYDEWLTRQQAAGVPLILTDTPRIRNDDRSALRKALERWAAIDDPTLVVLPLEPWWLREGLPHLIEEVRAAGRPVAIVLLHRYNGLDTARAMAGLLTFIAEVEPLPVVLLRCDISAVGAVAHRAFAGFVGWSANTRHGPLPMRRPTAPRAMKRTSPSVFVPALHNYVKTSKLPALARDRRTTRCAAATRSAAAAACWRSPSSARPTCGPAGCWRASTTWPAPSRSPGASCPRPNRGTPGGTPAGPERRPAPHWLSAELACPRHAGSASGWTSARHIRGRPLSQRR